MTGATYLNPKDQAALLTQLVAVTERDRLVWSATQVSPALMEARTERHDFQLFSRDGDDLPPFVLLVRADDRVLAEIESTAASEPWAGDAEYFESTKKGLATLYDLAYRKSFQIDKVVHELFEDLAELNEEPPF